MANLWQEVAAGPDTGSIWERLDSDLSEPAALDSPAGGLWGLIVVARADGLWSDAGKETLLLDRPELHRQNLWVSANDETLVLPREGAVAIWQAVLARPADTHPWDLASTVQMHRPEAAEDMWSRAQNETVVVSRPEAGSVFQANLAERNLTTWRPRRRSGWALKELTDHTGQQYWILKNLRENTYVRLSEEQVFVWKELDGKASVQDIAMAYLIAYGKLAIDGLILLLERLQQQGFIEDPLINVYGAVDESMARQRANVWWRRLLSAFLNKEFAIQGIDDLVTRTYRWGGRLLFTPPFQVAFLLMALAGAGAFFVHMRSGAYSVFTGAGQELVIGLITLYVLQFVTLLLHEWAHAVTTKHFRREVRKGGFLLYLGMPAAFVDTTDIWMSPRRERLLVSWAGPYSGFILGGLAALLIFAVPGALAGGVLYQFAFLTYLTSFLNLNPLLKLDGYYILMDWLEIPRLREKSLAFVTAELWPRLRARKPFSREERIFTVFGLLAGAWTIFALLLAIQLWGGGLLDLLRSIGSTPVGAAALIVFALAILFLLLRRYVWRSLRRVRQRASG
jgi:hypothetical protein